MCGGTRRFKSSVTQVCLRSWNCALDAGHFGDWPPGVPQVARVDHCADRRGEHMARFLPFHAGRRAFVVLARAVRLSAAATRPRSGSVRSDVSDFGVTTRSSPAASDWLWPHTAGRPRRGVLTARLGLTPRTDSSSEVASAAGADVDYAVGQSLVAGSRPAGVRPRESRRPLRLTWCRCLRRSLGTRVTCHLPVQG